MADEGEINSKPAKPDGITSSIQRKPRIEVPTSVGTLYARHLTIGDILHGFKAYLEPERDKTLTDFRTLGELALRTLVTRHKDGEQEPALDAATYQSLAPQDIGKLAEGVAQACAIGALDEQASLESLGAKLDKELCKQGSHMADTATKMRETFRLFSGISENTRKALEGSLGQFMEARDLLRRSPAFEAYKKLQDVDDNRLKGAKDSLKSLSIGSLWNQGPAQGDKTTEMHDAIRLHLEPISNSSVPFKDTPLGRAAKASEESARQLQELSALTAQLAESVAGLSEAVLTKALPEWFKNLESSAQTAETTLRQTGRSLFWAKWALAGSILVTIAMTGWQLWVGRAYQESNDNQQNRIEKILAAQLAEGKSMDKQLSRNANQESRLERLLAAKFVENRIMDKRLLERSEILESALKQSFNQNASRLYTTKNLETK